MRLKYYFNLFIFALIYVLNIPLALISRLFKMSYQIVVPAATYAPWREDKEYRKVFRKIKKNSLVNFFQGFELWKLAEQVDKLEGDIIEVGVWRGSTSIIMATKLAQLGSSKKIYACDTFEGVVKSDSEHDNFYKDGEHSDTSLEYVKNRIEKDHGLNNVELLKGIFPDDTCHLVEDKKFSFCHIDVDSYISAKEVMDWVWSRMEIGGMIAFNDYGFPMTKGITKLVNEYSKDTDKAMIHNLNGHGILVKVR